ncbi:lipid-A-disaccharide synthase [Helicobacter himalayensis]|uniref:lipid-A-disaccharide synthase n=1 Tax=Helicobacter himalayensis TaxID=1591088 RepID=UPI003D6EC6EB
MRLFISALEPSANIHLRPLALELDKLAGARMTRIEIVGIFEKRAFVACENLSANSHYEMSDFAAMGFVDVLKKIFFYKRVNKEMIELASTCDKALLLDSSSFHIPLAKGLKKLEARQAIPQIIYYILPQVWAWKSWRAKELEKIFDRLCAILPFEIAFYPNALKEGRVRYVGNPLLDELPLKQKARENGRILFMPGSRKGEIKRVFPLFVELGRHLRGKQKILALPKHFENLTQEELQNIYGKGIWDFTLSFDSIKELRICEFAFICSGTATLQASILGAPFVLAYRMRALEFHLLRFFVRLKVIGLANILFQALQGERAGKGNTRLHKELIQKDLNVENLLEIYKNFDFKDFATHCTKLREYLKNGSSHCVAEILLS